FRRVLFRSPRDAPELLGRGLDDLRVLRRLAEPHVDDHLRDLRDGHHVGVPELLHQGRRRLVGIALLQPTHLSITPPLLRLIRTFRPSSSVWKPTRVPLPASGSHSITFDAWMDASCSTMPPWMLRWGLGLVWRFTRFTPSTTTRLRAVSTNVTRPRLPRSLPAITITSSFLR